MHILNQPAPEQVAAALAGAGLVEKGAEVVASGEGFHVSRGGRRIFWVVAGKHLAALENTASAFHAACPSITVPIAFSFTREAVDYLGFRIPEGPALAAVSSAAAAEAARALQLALSQTEEPSTQEAALQELDLLIPHLFTSGEDRYFEESFPYDCARPALDDWIRRRASLTTRWTNGAFVPEEIVLDAGGPRFMNYVHARRTHFFTNTSARDIDALLIRRMVRGIAAPHSLELELQARQLRINALEQSLSWRITAPLRRFAKWIL